MIATLEHASTVESAVAYESEAARHAANLARWLGRAPTTSHVHQLTAEATLSATSYEDALAEIPAIADWGEKNYWIPPDAGRKKSLIKLLPHQKIIMHLFFSQDVAEYFGTSSFQTIVFSTIKKSGKTALAGMVARWIAETWGAFGEVYSMANDLEQARGRIYAAALASIMLDPRYNKQARGIPDLWRIIERQATHLPNNSTLRAVSADYKGEAGSNPVATLWCVAGETEVLTKRGWVRADELKDLDQLATLLPDGKMAYEVPKAINKREYSGEMVRFTHRRSEFLVTPNHRVYGRFSSGPHDKCADLWDFEEAGELEQGIFGRGWLKGYAEGVSFQNSCTVADARFWGYWLSEGHVNSYSQDKEATHVTISQSRLANPETYVKIGEAMRAYGLTPVAHGDSWTAKAPQLAHALQLTQGHSWTRNVPDYVLGASSEVQREFLLAFLEGDGWEAGEGYQCETTSKQLADDLMRVGLHAGFHPRLMLIREGRVCTLSATDNVGRVSYRLSFSTGTISWSMHKGGPHWSREHYSGTVVCPSLEHGTFFIRYRGKTVWTGNSELWGYSSESSLRLWEELTPVPTRPRSIRYIETYAGYEGESSILNDLEDRIKKEGRRLDLDELRVLLDGTGLEWPVEWHSQDLPFFVHPITRTIAYWDEGTEARRMPWQSNEYYMAQAGTLRPQAFKRLHLNHRSSNVEDFIPPEWWDRLYDANLREVSHDEPLVVGADASVTGDCTGLVAVSRHPSQRDQIATRKVAIWEPHGGKALNYRLTIEPTLRLWCTGHIHPLSEPCNNHAMIDLLGPCIPQKKYNVVQIAYDPYQLHDLMTRLTTDSVAWCRPFSQQGARLMADKQLYDLIKDERIHHDNHPQLGEHIKNCAAKYPPDDNTRLRLIKKAPKAKIDLAVCTSMASAEALRLSI